MLSVCNVCIKTIMIILDHANEPHDLVHDLSNASIKLNYCLILVFFFKYTENTFTFPGVGFARVRNACNPAQTFSDI